MGKHLLSKSTFIRGMQCQKSLYLHKKRPFLRDKMSPEQLAKFRRGTDVGVLARDLFPGGIDMSPKSPSQYQLKREETENALHDPTVQVIYEAVVQFDDVLIMLDILVREGDKWKAIEVKSSLKISDTYLQDAALQYYVLKNAGIQMSDFSLLYVNADYTFDEDLQLDQLFVNQSVIEFAESQLADTAHKISLCKQTLALQKSPDIGIGPQCSRPYPCDFKGHCWKSVPSDSLLYATAIDEEERFSVFHKGESVAPNANDQQHNERIEKQIDALKNHTFSLNKEILATKFHGLNFGETIFVKVLYYKPAIPFLYQTKPYQAVPLALALHYRENNKWKSSAIHCSDTLHDWQKVIQFMGAFVRDHTTLVVFEDADFPVIFSSILQGAQSKVQLIDLSDFLQEADFFYGNTNGLNTFELAVSALLPTEKLPKNEVWLRKDLLEGAPEKSSSVLRQLEKYPLLMASLLKKLHQIT